MRSVFTQLVLNVVRISLSVLHGLECMLCKFRLYYTAWVVCCANFTRVHFGNLVNVITTRQIAKVMMHLCLPSDYRVENAMHATSQKRRESMREKQELKTVFGHLQAHQNSH